VNYDRLLTGVLQYGRVVTLQSGSESPLDSRFSSLAYIVGLRGSRPIRPVALAGSVSLRH
jgi:hypothetical protein